MSQIDPRAEFLTEGLKSYPNAKKAVEVFETVVGETAKEVIRVHLKEIELVTGQPNLKLHELNIGSGVPNWNPAWMNRAGAWIWIQVANMNGIGITLDGIMITLGVTWDSSTSIDPLKPRIFVSIHVKNLDTRERLFRAMIEKNGKVNQVARIEPIPGNEVRVIMPQLLLGVVTPNHLKEELAMVLSIFLSLIKKADRCRVSPIFPMCGLGNPVSPGSLVSSPPEEFLSCGNPERQEFRMNSTTLCVDSNVLYLPSSRMPLLQSALLIEHPGIDELRAKMRSVINEIKSFVGRLTDPKPEIEGIIKRLESIADQLSVTTPDELCRQLEKWDEASQKLKDCMREIKKIPPIYLFLWPGFFLDRSVPLDNIPFPPGCYIEENERLSSEEKEQTRLHEMAHAAMATYRAAGSVVGCRWMEEGFAEFLVSHALPTPGQCRENWGELDVYVAWRYLKNLEKQGGIGEVEKLLERWLNPQPLCAFCDDVRKMRDFNAQ